MSRSKLSNNELKFYNTAGDNDVVMAKIKGTSADSLILEGSSSATKVSLKNVADPTGTGEVATFDWVNSRLDSLSNGLTWKSPVVCKSTSNIPATLVGNVLTCTSDGQQTMDGILVSTDSRVLIGTQTDATQNGIYTCTTQGNSQSGQEAPAVFTRSQDCDSATELKACAVFVERGTTHADTGYVQTTDALILGTSNIEFVQFSSPGEIIAGSGVTKTGNTVSVNVDNAYIELEAGNLTIKDGSITADKIQGNSITGSQIQDASIFAAEMADDSAPRRCIENGAVNASKLDTDAVTEVKILDGAVTEDKILDASVTTDKINQRHVTADRIALFAVTSDELAENAVTTDKLEDGSVRTAHIFAGEVKENNIGTNAVTTNKINGLAVTSAKIQLLNVQEGHLANNAVTTLKIKSNQINDTHLKSNSVTELKIQDGAVTANKIGTGAITTSKIGTLNGLTVNGIVNATSFVATSASGESDAGFALPKCKSLNNNFTTGQTIPGDNLFHILGSDSTLSAPNFAFDDDITMCITLLVGRLNHLGSNNSMGFLRCEVSYYTDGGSPQAYQDVSGQDAFIGLSTPFSASVNYGMGGQFVVGDGVTRIAGVRVKMMQDGSGDTFEIVDQLQLTGIAIEDSSGSVTRTFNNGSIS